MVGWGWGYLRKRWTQTQLRMKPRADSGELSHSLTQTRHGGIRSLVVVQLLQERPPPSFQLTLAQLAF